MGIRARIFTMVTAIATLVALAALALVVGSDWAS
jgi:hypothetical protein